MVRKLALICVSGANINMTFQAAMPAIDTRLIATSRTFAEAAESYIKQEDLGP